MSWGFRYKNFIFLAAWMAISFLFEFQKIVFLAPVSVHQGAQSDRASIALNYSRVSLNFFQPRVMETGTKDGITPCEFPLVNYTVGLMYKAFGFHSFWYRFLMWCLMGLGLWAAFDLVFRWINDLFASLLLVFAWYSGTILAFYTANFLPDTASLSLMLLALRQWFLFRSGPDSSRKTYFLILAGIASLIKITSFLFVIAIALTSLFLRWRKKETMAFGRESLIILLAILAWYGYGVWLEREVGGSYFLMSTAIPVNVQELKEWFHIFYSNWFNQTYQWTQWGLIGLGLAATFFLKEHHAVKGLIWFSLPGVLGFYLLMAGQFRYHDYYVICLLPLALFLMVFAHRLLFRIHPILTYVAITAVCAWGLLDAKNGVRLRFTPGSYWYQTFFEPADFEGMPYWLARNGIDESEKILVAFDPNPNTLLYFFNRRGYRTFDHPPSYIREKLILSEALIVKDEKKFFEMYPDTRKTLVLKDEYRGWQMYQLR